MQVSVQISDMEWEKSKEIEIYVTPRMWRLLSVAKSELLGQCNILLVVSSLFRIIAIRNAAVLG